MCTRIKNMHDSMNKPNDKQTKRAGDFAAELLPGNRVVALGGENSGGKKGGNETALHAAEEFIFADNIWVPVAPMPEVRGGEGTRCLELLNHLPPHSTNRPHCRLNPNQPHPTDLTSNSHPNPKPTPAKARFRFDAAHVNGKDHLYIFGGQPTCSNNPTDANALGRCAFGWVYSSRGFSHLGGDAAVVSCFVVSFSCAVQLTRTDTCQPITTTSNPNPTAAAAIRPQPRNPNLPGKPAPKSASTLCGATLTRRTPTCLCGPSPRTTLSHNITQLLLIFAWSRPEPAGVPVSLASCQLSVTNFCRTSICLLPPALKGQHLLIATNPPPQSSHRRPFCGVDLQLLPN